MTDLLAMERREKLRDRYSSINGDILEREYLGIQIKLESLRNRMRATWSRYPGQVGWPPAIQRCEKIIAKVKEAKGERV